MSDVTYSREGTIAVLEIDNPPVNALSQAVRQGLADGMRDACDDDEVQAILIVGKGRTFIAGADIREFGKPLQEPFLPDLCNWIEATPKPVVVALHGTALGGGLEVALAGHYRVAIPSARFGLPEVKLGLIPGAGGTQRLPRLVPMESAIAMATTGNDISAAEALEAGLIDHLDEGTDIRAAGLAYAQSLVDQGAAPRPTRDGAISSNAVMFEQASLRLNKSARGQIAPQRALDALAIAGTIDFDEGLSRERALFMELMKGEQRGAMIHAFFAERQVAKLPEIKDVPPRGMDHIGVIGGGTMGAGIATACLLAGLQVSLIERDEAASQAAEARVVGLLDGAVKRGKLSQSARDAINFKAVPDYAALSDADIVIEAVFESLEVKQQVFETLDRVCKPGAILASNTSYLDLDAVARFTNRPQDVIGLHFFSPAHVMRLLEVVVGAETAPDVTATGFALAKRLKKIAVRAGVCDGFIGNRILAHFRKALDGAVLAGASPAEVDDALVTFGMAMGPYAVMDLAGLDIAWANRKRLADTRDPAETYAEFADKLCEAGQFGRKTGQGFYIYGDGAPQPNPALPAILSDERARKGITARTLSPENIADRFMAAMINEAARVVEDGIALRPLDVDVTLINGYGFPRWRGGPLHYADQIGLDRVIAIIEELAKEDDFLWKPAPLLIQLHEEGRKFSDLNG